MTFTTATLADVPTIKALADKIWPRTYRDILTPAQVTYMMDMMYSTEALTKQIGSGDYTFLIFSDNDQLAGFAAYSATAEAHVYKLHKIYLDHDLQGKGLGKEMMQAVKMIAKEKGATILELDVNRDNKALFFYEKQGFTIHETKDTHIGNGYYMNDYVMRIGLGE